jgi:mitochondrial import receptor subunit TOM40
MMWVSGVVAGIRNIFSGNESKVSFDSYNSEASEISTLQVCGGIKTEVSKLLSPRLQVSRIDFFDGKVHMSQVFGALSLKNSLVQFGMDNEGSMRLRAVHTSGGVIGKIHTIVSGSREVFSQAQVDIKSKASSIGLKLISPAIKGSRMICVANVLQQFGSLCVGVEVIKTNDEVGVSTCGRYEGNKGIFSVGLQQFTALSMSYYHRFSKMFDAGAEIHMPRGDSISGALGCRLVTSKAQVRASVNSNMALGIALEERVTDGLALNANLEIGRSGCTHGLGFSLEF